MTLSKSIFKATALAEHQIGEQIFNKTIKNIFFNPITVDIVFSDNSGVTFYTDLETDCDKNPAGVIKSIYWPKNAA